MENTTLNTLYYYPFGLRMFERSSNSSDYRYGFNGKESDDEVKGEGAQYDYGFRIYDPRIAKFLSVDPLTASYPFYTPYQFAGNMPIWAIDLDGLEELIQTTKFIELSTSQIAVFKSSEVLTNVYNDISKPEKRATQKVYFATYKESSGIVRKGTQGFTTDIGGRAKFINDYEKLSRLDRMKVANPNKQFKIYNEYKKLFKEVGIDYNEVYDQVNNGAEVYMIAVEENSFKVNSLAESTMTLTHEIAAHLIRKLTGKSKETDGGSQDHIDFFNLDENKGVLTESEIQRGYSPRYNDIPEDSPAGEYKKEIETTIDEMPKPR